MCFDFAPGALSLPAPNANSKSLEEFSHFFQIQKKDNTIGKMQKKLTHNRRARQEGIEQTHPTSTYRTTTSVITDAV